MTGYDPKGQFSFVIMLTLSCPWSQPVKRRTPYLFCMVS